MGTSKGEIMSILVISGSLRTESRSRVLAKKAVELLKAENADVKYVDLRDYPMPLCDGGAAYEHEDVARMTAFVQEAKVILVAVPVYNFDVNAAVKNLVELTGRAWEDKIVGFLCAAGGRSSYMSIMNLCNDLMLDFRCVIIPRFVYAAGGDFTEGAEITICNEDIQERIRQLSSEAIRFSRF
jgi:FMN reductase